MLGDIAKSSWNLREIFGTEELLQAAEWLRTAWGTWVQKIGQLMGDVKYKHTSIYSINMY